MLEDAGTVEVHDSIEVARLEVAGIPRTSYLDDDPCRPLSGGSLTHRCLHHCFGGSACWVTGLENALFVHM